MFPKIIKQTYDAICVPAIILRKEKQINNYLSKVSLIGLSALAYYLKPREFVGAVTLGALWQTSLIVLKVQRPVKDKHCGTDADMGCVDGYSKWFTGVIPLHIEKVAGGTWLAAEHILKHPKTITFANFLGVCMGIRLVNLFRDQLGGSGEERFSVNRRNQDEPILERAN